MHPLRRQFVINPGHKLPRLLWQSIRAARPLIKTLQTKKLDDVQTRLRVGFLKQTEDSPVCRFGIDRYSRAAIFTREMRRCYKYAYRRRKACNAIAFVV